ncbi:MAG: ABC transporter substrate-binding protein [Corynebacterium sp.]|nr:ABC transporter substrate-binding protein [Corynebacterium sp.]
MEKLSMKPGRKALKIIATLGAAGLAVAGLAACSSSSSSSSSASGLFTVYGCEPERTLVPADTNQVCSNRIIQNIYAGLVYIDQQGQPQMDLAKSIELQGDRTYHVTLKDDLKFSDGQAITSHSFVDAWNYAVANNQMAADSFKVIQGYAEGAQSMSGLQVIDDKNFTITLNEPQTDFLLELAYHSFFPLPASAFSDMTAYVANPIGSGPYKIQSWNHEQEMTVVPNENYTGPQKPKNNGFTFKMYSKLDAAYTDLIAGNLDVLEQVPSSAYATLKQDLGDRAVTKSAGISQFIGVKEDQAHFGNDEEGRLRRQAISMAFDRDQISQQIFNGVRQAATEFTAPVVSGYDSNLDTDGVLKYNPEKAKQLWEQANAISPWSGQLKLNYNADADHQAWTTAIANQVGSTLGVDVVANSYPDFKSMISDVRSSGLNGFYRTGWTGDYPSMGNFLTPMFTTNGSGNNAKYSNAQFDALMNQAATAGDVNKANELYNQAQRILYTDMPLIPTWYGAVAGGYSTNVKNVDFAWNSYPIYTEIQKA